MNNSQIKNNQVKTYGLMVVAALAVALAVGAPSVKGHADTTAVGIQPASQMIATGGESAAYAYAHDNPSYETMNGLFTAVYWDSVLGVQLDRNLLTGAITFA